MALTAIGRAALVAREALKTRAYRDSVGVLTIGIGHTSAAGPPQVTAGLTITVDEALAIFDRDLAKYEATVDRVVTVPLADHERDALASICYNIGQNGFARATFVRKLNAGDRDACAKAIMSWTKPAEVTSRRQAESDQFLTPYGVQMPKARNTDRGRVKVGQTASATPSKPKDPPVARGAAPARAASSVEALPEFTVRGIQQRLIALRYHEVGLVDGKIGPRFKNALAQIQQRAADLGERVKVDGLYGPQTQTLLDESKGDRFAASISSERANITARDLAAVGTPAVTKSRKIVWSSIGSVLMAGGTFGVALIQGWQTQPDIPWYAQTVMGFLPPWVLPVVIVGLNLYNTAKAQGLITSAVERVREGIDNSGSPPTNAPGGLFGSLFGRS